MSAVTVVEKMESETTTVGAQNAHHREYFCFGSADQSDILSAVVASSAAPLNYSITVNGIVYYFIRDTLKAEPILNADPPTMWNVTLDYILQNFSKQPYQTGESSTSFAIGTTGTNIKQAVAESQNYAASGTAPTAGGLIGLNDDGSVTGVDVDFATSKFTETWYIADSSITDAYKSALTTLINTGPVNEASFRGYDAGEVRFIGASGSKRTNVSDWEVTFEFAVSLNSTNAAPASGITGIVKKGWEYLWFKYMPKVITVGSAKYTYSVVQFAYVDEVYPLGDFSVLGIGS